MRNNNIPVSILATALATSQLQAFVVPSVAMAADWDEAALASSTSIVRQVFPWETVTGQYPGTKVKVTVQVTATQQCGQFWVLDPYLTNDLEKQKFKLVLDGNEAPQCLMTQQTNTISITPLISDDGKTLGFQVPSMLAGQTVGIEYYLTSANNFRVLGNDEQSLSNWLLETDPATSSFAHFGRATKQVTVPMDPKLHSVESTGDAYSGGTLTVTLDTLGGDALDNVTIQKRYANALGSQLPTPTRAGYVFQGWFFDSNLTQPLAAENIPSDDFTLYAKWAQDVPAPTGVLSATSETAEDTKQTNGQATSNQATGNKSTSGNSTAKKGDLVPTGADQTVAVIVSSVSVIAGLSVMVLKRLQRR